MARLELPEQWPMSTHVDEMFWHRSRDGPPILSRVIPSTMGCPRFGTSIFYNIIILFHYAAAALSSSSSWPHAAVVAPLCSRDTSQRTPQHRDTHTPHFYKVGN